MPARSVRRFVALALIPTLAATVLLAACSGGDDDEVGAGEDDGPTTTTTTEVQRPEGPAADLSEELTAGNGVFLGAATTGIDLDEAGWVEHEFVAAGTATSYTADGDLPEDGRFELTEAGTADYRTRIVVRRPADAEDFDGTVVVEWLNVSGGLDANPDFSFTAEEMVRRGMAWVGVSAQRIGVEGGDVAVGVDIGEGITGQGLKRLDPARYGSLDHPGDAFAYDIYTQVARALRADGASGALGDLEVEHILAVGESQSAFALTTYVNGVQPLTRAFDGFLVHSRGGSPLPLGEPGKGVSIAESIGRRPARIRTDLDVPVIVLQMEGDITSVLGSVHARQPDTEDLRLWEVAGAAHADAFLIGPLADSVDCGAPVNRGPQRFAVRAALRHLDAWVRGGEAPPEAPRIETDEKPAIVRDADGLAQGGIRYPQVEVPVAVLSGEPGPRGGTICLLLGSTLELPAERLAELYDGPEDYLAAYEEATDAAIDAGFALEEDREELLADADPSRLGG